MRAHHPRRSAPAIVALLALVLPFALGAGGGDRTPVVVAFSEDVRDPDATAHELGRRHGFDVEHVYAHAVKGFAAEVPSRALDAIRRDDRVARLELDVEQHVVGQTTPTGVDRIETDANPEAAIDGSTSPTIAYDVAVIDTGLDRDHEDLNVAGGIDFVALLTSTWDDDNGHGSHVGGTIGAIDNQVGVVGVAPGARLWAAKVCNAVGTCLTSDIVAGIDWVAEQKLEGRTDFAVANMSISTQDSTASCAKPNDTVHQAICGVVDAGVVFALAAGNDGEHKDAYPVAFSVSAIADFDGRSGGLGSPTCRSDQDDTLADYSNHGSSIDIAAPGTCIRSTWWDGGYATISGTSMATPHVAGAVALYLHANQLAPATSTAGVSSIEDAIRDAALPQGTSSHPCSYDDSRPGGPLLFVNAKSFGGDGTCDGQADTGGDGDTGGGATYPIDLAASGYKVKGVAHADLSWTGAECTGDCIVVFRDGEHIATTANDGAYTDAIGKRGGGSYTYEVCEDDGVTCSNPATVTF
jgi:subtilisin